MRSRVTPFCLVMIALGASRAHAEATPELPRAEVGPSHHWALEYNPLELMVGRVSANLEVGLGAHQALMLSPMILPPNTGDVGGGFWSELGYRFYSEDDGLSGFFVGPSVIGGTFSYFTDEHSGRQRGSAIGVALDGGYQFVFRSGFVLGFGVGAQCQQVTRSYEIRNDPLNEIIVETGVLPRILFSLGYSP
jgi:hypothetical protein